MVVVEWVVGIFFLDQFFTLRVSTISGVFAPSGPLAPSEKKKRSSKTPCGVWTYLFDTARPTVDGCTPISGYTLDHHRVEDLSLLWTRQV